MKSFKLTTHLTPVWSVLFTLIFAGPAIASIEGLKLGGTNPTDYIMATDKLCADSRKLTADAEAEFAKKCAEARFGADIDDCKQQAEDCLSDLESPTTACFKYVDSDYRSSKKSIDKDISDNEKDMQKLAEDAVKAKEKNQDQSSDLSKEMQKLQEEYDKLSMSTQEDQLKARNSLIKAQNESTAQINKLEMEIANANIEKADLLRQKSAAMRLVSKDLIVFKCDAVGKAKYLERKSVSNQNRGSFASLVGKGNLDGTSYRTAYQECVLKSFEEHEDRIAALEKKIKQTDLLITQGSNQIALLRRSVEDMQRSMSQSLSLGDQQARKAVQSLGQRQYQLFQDSQKQQMSFQQNMQLIQEKLNLKQMQLSRSQADLRQLGVDPQGAKAMPGDVLAAAKIYESRKENQRVACEDAKAARTKYDSQPQTPAPSDGKTKAADK